MGPKMSLCRFYSRAMKSPKHRHSPIAPEFLIGISNPVGDFFMFLPLVIMHVPAHIIALIFCPSMRLKIKITTSLVTYGNP
jgi:hypothetical protein